MAFCQFENFMTSANRGSSFLFFLFLVILSKASKEHASFKFQIDLSIILPSHIFVLKNTHKKKLKKSLSSTSGLRGHLLLAFLNEKKPFNQNFHFVNKMSKKKKKKNGFEKFRICITNHKIVKNGSSKMGVPDVLSSKQESKQYCKVYVMNMLDYFTCRSNYMTLNRGLLSPFYHHHNQCLQLRRHHKKR